MDTPIDKIENILKKLKHKTWGFVIYRSTCTSDDDFASFVSSIQAYTSENLISHAADTRALAQTLSWTIVEDRDRLDGARAADVRQIFNEWCESSEAAAEQPEATHSVARSQNARYRFCVHIDETSLESFKNSDTPWVKVILRNWPYWPEDDDNDEDEDEDDDVMDGGSEDLEGEPEIDVGSCRVRASFLLPATFSQLCGANAWYVFYQRPPIVV